MQASPQQLPLLAMSSPHCLEEIAATADNNIISVTNMALSIQDGDGFGRTEGCVVFY